jgi:NAD(P)-dependent dehydrogenase (short-subunit alcohol dehydrogenase family)
MKLENKVAVVTGAAQGIGRATALMMAREGAQIVVADLQGEKAQAVANEVKEIGAAALSVAVDVASEASVRQMAKAAFERFGRIDILANIAGIYFPKKIGR